MLRVEEWMDIKDLHRQGYSIRAIADQTGSARNTVRRVLRAPVPAPAQRRHRASCLDPYKPYLLAREQTGRLSAVRLLEELRPQGYTGSVHTVRRFVRALRADQQTRAKLTVRFETPPGQQAQVDWFSAGKCPTGGGRTEPVYGFVLVLGFSRLLYVEFVTSMRLPTLLGCHLNAFTCLGGVPQSILYDNMKQVRAAPGRWHPLFLDFCGHYGIVPKTHRVRRPRTKGKVERAIRYVQENFLQGRSFADLADLNAQVRRWLDQVANVRLHATTAARPCDLWQQEQPFLTPLRSIPPYQLWEHADRTVDVEGYVRLGRSRYSVPPEYVGKRVVVVEAGPRLQIRWGAVVIADHPRAPSPGACLTDPVHREAFVRQALGHRVPETVQQVVARRVVVDERPLAVYEEASR